MDKALSFSVQPEILCGLTCYEALRPTVPRMADERVDAVNRVLTRLRFLPLTHLAGLAHAVCFLALWGRGTN